MPRSGPGTAVALGLVAAVLYGWGLARGGTHYYYSAAVRSMATNWSAFVFGSLDPAGSITVDKSPGGLWVQALCVRVFGFHGAVLVAPEAVAAAVAVPLLGATVRRWAGARAGVLAALLLAASPAVYAVARVNIPDAVLVLCLVGAAYTATRAVQAPDGGLGWVAATGALIGAGFLVKMGQAWLILPGVVAAYLVAPGRTPRVRWGGAGLLVAVCVLVSLSWVTLVSLVPSGSRPYVDGSSTDSAWQMVFDYNGVGRGSGATMSVPFGGGPGPLRLLNTQLAGQIGWLLPAAAILGVGAAALTWRRHPGLRPGWVLWGGWLVVVGAALSTAHGVHPYYTATLAPAIAALVATGTCRCLILLRRDAAAGLLLAAAITLTVVTAVVVVERTPPWGTEATTILVAAVALAGAVALIAVALATRTTPLPGLTRPTRRLRLGHPRVGATAAVLVAVAAPVAWIAVTPPVAAHSFPTTNPVAGPAAPDVVYGQAVTTPTLAMMTGTPPGASVPPPTAVMAGSTPDPGLLAFLRRTTPPHQRYTLATGDASSAAPYITAGLSVLPMGGFTATAPYPTPTDLATLVLHHDLRFVLLIPMPGQTGPAAARTDWLTHHCTPADPTTYGNNLPYAVLYDCTPSSPTIPNRSG